MFDMLLDYLTHLCVSLYNIFVDFFVDIYNAIVDCFSSAFSSLISLLPDLTFSLSSIEPYYNLINVFFPVEYALILFVCYCNFCLLVLYIKWILGLIPTIS